MLALVETIFSSAALLLADSGRNVAPIEEAPAGQAGWWTLGIVLGCGFAVGVGYWLYTVWLKRCERQAAQDPWHLFAELCKVHGLTGAQGRLMRKMAAAEKAESPMLLFLEPDRLERMAKLPAWRGHSQKIQDVAKILFGTLAG